MGYTACITHSMIMVRMKVALACWQCPTLLRFAATSQLLVMYHGRPLLMWSGSSVSGADCPYMLYAKSPTSRPWMMKLSSGPMKWKGMSTILRIRINVARMEMTRLKVVILTCMSAYLAISCSWWWHSRLAPDKWDRRVAVVRCSVQWLVWATIEAIEESRAGILAMRPAIIQWYLLPIFPELGSVCIWVRNTNQGEERHDQQQFQRNKPNDCPEDLPAPSLEVDALWLLRHFLCRVRHC